ncbi:MAG: hypothetical protein JWO86_4599 [Myxococcaceae bacterium]|jgi:hypothetical protein|nr:hypothetical protein [Myxococcaceae bacterium]MEA2749494.1 hypothetical protein [Myxococcales bacterium]
MRNNSKINCSQPVHGASALGLLLLLVAGCGGGDGAQPVVPAASVPSAASGTAPGSAPGPGPAAPADPFAVPGAPRDDDAPEPGTLAALDLEPWKKATKAKGVAPSPASCAAYANRAPSTDASDVVGAFSEKDPAKRDARLVALTKDPKTNVVLNRALRADLAPIECADAIVDPLLLGPLGSSPSADPVNVRLLVGFSLAGKLARTANAPPAMGAIRDKEKVKAFVNGPLKAWLLEQSTAIELLSSGAAGLSGYARGVAAIEAGIAELRLVDRMRSAPVPATWDPELKSIYEAALDEALEPRKKRGRDAALVGMSDFARVGIIRDARLDRARALLSKLYGGRRIDALDGLIVPAAVVPAPSTPQEAALASIPTYWLENGDIAHAEDPRFLANGVTRGLREHFKKLPEGAADELRSPYARARLGMGRVYWRRVDFVEAAHAAAPSKNPEDRLVLAISLALAHGPNGAAEMMRAPTPTALDLRHTDALDALVNEGGPLAGMAAYDAAHLRALSPPEGADASAYLRDVALRFRKAETLLTDPAQKKTAGQRAAEVDAIVAASASATK